MHPVIQSAVAKLLTHNDLTSDEMRACVDVMMEGDAEPVDMAAFLTAMTAKQPVAEELIGAAQAMRSRSARITTTRSPLIDTCGTGGDCLHTFNISTATAIVLAACGLNVAKHGNRSVSSSSGSADVLEALGVNVNLSAAAASTCLNTIGIAFCFAPLFHGAMKHVAPVRRQLAFPTIFNLLGPLTNPAAAEFQLIGASSIAKAQLLAAAMAQLTNQRAFVVCGNNEIDEVCLWGPTTVFEVIPGQVRQTEWTPDVFGLPACSVKPLQVHSAEDSAQLIRFVLDGRDFPATHIVIANAAAGLMLAGRASSLSDAAKMVQSILADGSARQKLNQLVDLTTASLD